MFSFIRSLQSLQPVLLSITEFSLLYLPFARSLSSPGEPSAVANTMPARSIQEFFIYSINDNTELHCRIYCNHTALPGTNRQEKSLNARLRGAILACSRLGESFDNPALQATRDERLDQGFTVGMFSFRGTGISAGALTRVGKAEIGDFVSFVAFFLHYINLPYLVATPSQSLRDPLSIPFRHSASLGGDRESDEIINKPVLVLGGIGFGAIVVERLPTIRRIMSDYCYSGAEGCQSNRAKARELHGETHPEYLGDVYLDEHGGCLDEPRAYHLLISPRIGVSPLILRLMTSRRTELAAQRNSSHEIFPWSITHVARRAWKLMGLPFELYGLQKHDRRNRLRETKNPSVTTLAIGETMNRLVYGCSYRIWERSRGSPLRGSSFKSVKLRSSENGWQFSPGMRYLQGVVGIWLHCVALKSDIAEYVDMDEVADVGPVSRKWIERVHSYLLL